MSPDLTSFLHSSTCDYPARKRTVDRTKPVNIHDADFEYHSKDLLRIVEVFQQERADAVYGSRFAGGAVRRVLMFRHELGNKFLTFPARFAISGTRATETGLDTSFAEVTLAG